MKCRLCGQPTAGQDKLCGDCGKALRRVRNGSMALRKLRMYSVRADGMPPPPAATAQEPETRAKMGRQGWAVLLGAVGLVAIALIYWGQRTPDRSRDQGSTVLDERARALDAPRLDGKSLVAVPPAEALPLSARTHLPETAEPPISAKAGQPAPPGTSARPPARANGNARVAAVSATAEATARRPKLPNDDASRTNTAQLPPEVDPSAQGTRPPVSAPSEATEGGQGLTAALEKCGEEKFLASVICEQKARLRYCEGKWGRVPQCNGLQRVD
jgi:hypothetical protein